MVRFVEDGGERSGSDQDALAPVIPLFPGARSRSASARQEAGRRPEWHPTWTGDADDDVVSVDGDVASAQHGKSTQTERGGEVDVAATAEQALLRRLRTRSMSLAEARALLAEHSLDETTAEALIQRFEQLGYLDDTALAEQLVHAGVDRKGQGRRTIAQSLTQRGVPRDIADAVLAELPDDDAERALAYARGKAGALARLDREVALRRLVGQLVRRGYGSSVAMSSARRALDEAAAGD